VSASSTWPVVVLLLSLTDSLLRSSSERLSAALYAASMQRHQRLSDISLPVQPAKRQRSVSASFVTPYPVHVIIPFLLNFLCS